MAPHPITAVFTFLIPFIKASLYRVIPNHPGIPVAAFLNDPFLGMKVHEYDSETASIPKGPFKIVIQGPLEISLHIDPLGNSFPKRAQMPVKIILPRSVLHLSLHGNHVMGRGAVFCNINVLYAIFILHAQEHVGKALLCYRPVPVIDRNMLWILNPETKRPYMRVCLYIKVIVIV